MENFSRIFLIQWNIFERHTLTRKLSFMESYPTVFIQNIVSQIFQKILSTAGESLIVFIYFKYDEDDEFQIKSSVWTLLTNRGDF